MAVEPGVVLPATGGNKINCDATMRRVLFLALVLAGTAGLLFAQGRLSSGPGMPYDAKTPPPLSLSQAYALALGRIGPATNHFYCLSASCLDKTLPQYAGWVLWFSNTNGERARVEVYFQSKSADIPDATSAALLR